MPYIPLYYMRLHPLYSPFIPSIGYSFEKTWLVSEWDKSLVRSSSHGGRGYFVIMQGITNKIASLIKNI